jgi:organic radical activating enzyme
MSVLKIHTTYRCTSTCAHCHLRAGRDRPDKSISYDWTLSTIQELKRLNNLELVVFLGGEPGLYPELLHRLAASIHALGVGLRVETNASWAVDHAAAMKFLEPLVAAKTQVMFSIDSFHEPFVDPAQVVEAIGVVVELSGSWNIETPYLDFVTQDNPRDRRTLQLREEALKGIEQRTGLVLNPEIVHSVPGQYTIRLFSQSNAYLAEDRVYFKGRGAHTLAPLVAEGRGVPAEVCDTVPWWDNGSQSTTELLALDPDGYISKECGIVIGNVEQNSMADILDGFNASQHPILSTLINEGPLGLAREAGELGYVMKADYADKCHLCQEAREVLRVKYPEYLAPEQQYVDPYP